MIKLIWSVVICMLSMSSVVWSQNVVLKNPHPSSFGVRQGVSFGVNGSGFIGLFDTMDSTYFWKYNTVTDSWVRIPNMPGPKRVQYASGFAIDNTIYVVGGSGTSPTNILRGVYAYNTTSNVWSVKGVFPDSGRAVGIGLSVGDKGYFGLGSTNNPSQAILDNSFYEYNAATDHWTKMADFPGVGRQFAFGFVLNNKIIIGGGYDASYNYLNDLWEYDPSSDNWTQLNAFMSAFPLGIVGSVGFSIQQHGYIACGSLGSNTVFSKLIYEYDPINKDFIESSSNNMPINEGRKQVCAFGLGDKGYVIGGWNSSLFKGYNDVYEFTPPVTGIDEEQMSGIYFYPNPSKGKIAINLGEHLNEVENITILNVLGEKLFNLSQNSIQKNNNTIELDIHSLKSGVYFLSIDFGHSQSIKKIVVE
jgi:N-acetylneuraminic acid mutarotase